MHLYIKLLLPAFACNQQAVWYHRDFLTTVCQSSKFFSILERGPGDNNFRLFSHNAQLFWTMPGTVTLSPVGFNISNISLWRYAPSWFAYCQNTQRRRNHLRHQLACICYIHCSSVCVPHPWTLKSTLAWLSTSTCTIYMLVLVQTWLNVTHSSPLPCLGTATSTLYVGQDQSRNTSCVHPN